MGACTPTGVSFIYSIMSLIPYIIIMLFLALTFLAKGSRQFKMSMLLLSAYIIGDRVLKNLFSSPRPQGACKKSFGFPSSHMVVITCYTAQLWTSCKKSHKYFLLVMIMLQAFSRVELKYHTWEQVIGGIFFGVIYTLVFHSYYFDINLVFMLKLRSHSILRRR